MTHNILNARLVAAKNVDALNRSAVAATDVDNGNLVKLTTRSATAGQEEVFTAVTPSTANGLTGLWMVFQPEIVLTALGSGYMSGIDVDIRNFFVPSGKVFSVFKPQLGDIIEMTGDGLAGTKSTNTFVNATDTTGGLKPVWGASQTSNVFSMKLLETSYYPLATGAIDSQRVTSYVFEVVGL